MDNDRFPAVPTSLIKALDERFPSQCPRLSDEDRMIWYSVGQRATVEFLIDMHNRQNENILNTGE